jgi:hypothetical protein
MASKCTSVTAADVERSLKTHVIKARPLFATLPNDPGFELFQKKRRACRNPDRLKMRGQGLWELQGPSCFTASHRAGKYATGAVPRCVVRLRSGQDGCTHRWIAPSTYSKPTTHHRIKQQATSWSQEELAAAGCRTPHPAFPWKQSR